MYEGREKDEDSGWERKLKKKKVENRDDFWRLREKIKTHKRLKMNAF